jgi:hypothetical protein
LKVLSLGDHVVEAIKPSALARLEAQVRDDLRIVLTVIKHAETMAHLTTFRGTALTRISKSDTSDFHYGTTATGVVLRPIDDQGSQIPVERSRACLSTVYSVAILAVGLSLKEATTT